MSHSKFLLCAALTLAGAVSTVAAGSASAAPPAKGCPTGYDLVAVAPLTALGYRVPALVDSPATLSFGQPGNGDGLVCAVQLGNRLTPWGTSIYNFIDNQLPASP